ncbi:uncharacterized protein LOC128272226 [Anopheles cruzii]|uniref:uncharacterized protein LOC128272226 n=1 Tax=Anopheles cruzii TaxID=68878 RepID=UPI0022EC1F5E|nr:uncharacterized protein LOC128272226 [Anopheles cruzii]
MTLPLEACEILNHLNHLGYRNITAEQLKEFQKDLRKLVKFDSQLYGDSRPKDTDDGPTPDNVFERLHSGKTISYKAKVARKMKKIETADSPDKENRTEEPKPVPCKDSGKSCKMWIRPKSSQSFRRSDPVALYHSYQRDWNKFKLPGENDHAELRWKIRTKLLGE